MSGVLAMLAGCLTASSGDPTQDAVAKARRAAAKLLKADADTLIVETVADPAIPGLVVFHAEVPTDRAPVVHMGGAVVGGKVYTNGAEALGAVFGAWGYAPERTRSADEVARFAVLLVPADEPSAVLRTEDDMAASTRLGFPEAAPPADVNVNGQPGVRFWFQNGYNPVTEVTVAPAAAAGGAAVIALGRSHGGG